MSKQHVKRLHAEQLDGRDVPAAFVTPWPDPPHLPASLPPDDTTDPPSALDGHYVGLHSGLNASDISAIQALYGPRTPDAYNNHTLATAQSINLPNIQADVTTNTDLDYYRYRVPLYAGANVTV